MTEMTEKQIQIDALRDCVVHWTEVEAAERASDVRIGPGKCALCALYLVDYCQGCPVKEKTGQSRCGGTPYNAAFEALARWYKACEIGEGPGYCDAGRDEFREAARAERMWLESLAAELADATNETIVSHHDYGGINIVDDN